METVENGLQGVKSLLVDETQPQPKVDTQSRTWCWTFNNPTETEQELENYLSKLTNVRYFIFGKEKADTGTIHYQGYIEFSAPKKFSTMQKWLSPPNVSNAVNLEQREGTKTQARDYVLKVGKYADKAYTRIGEIVEWGEWVEERERTDLADLVEYVKQGLTDYEIMELSPVGFLRYNKHIATVRNTFMKAKYKKERRLGLEVTYIYGETQTGKTRYVMDKYGDENVYRVTDYERGTFDDYEYQDVVVFEEFRGLLKITDMLNYLDVYNVQLKARFQNKIACFTKVYILTNIPLTQQYRGVQDTELTSYNAFCRRIDNIFRFGHNRRYLEKGVAPEGEDFVDNRSTQQQHFLTPTAKLTKKEQQQIPFKT